MTALNIIEVPAPDQNTLWISKEYGIRSRREFQRHANQPLLERVVDVLSCQMRGLLYSFSAGTKRWQAKQEGINFPKFNDLTPIGSSNKTNTVGLAVLFHGLNGQPSLWDAHIALLKKHPSIDVYAPEIPDNGHRSLADKTSYALLERIVDWTNEHPGKPVALFGQSNGSRFALLFETWLRDRAPSTPVHVSLTAGVLYGTSTVDITNTLLRTNEYSATSMGALSFANCEELAFGSDTARKLVADARKPLAPGVAPRDYALYSPMHDIHVPDTGSGLPILAPQGQTSKTEKHCLVTNYGHNAIVTALAQKQIDDFVCWVKGI